jgi:hypothetical protein
MNSEHGAMFILEEYGNKYDMPNDGFHDRDVITSHDGVGPCGHDLLEWHQRPLPAIGLYLLEEWLCIPSLQTPIFHVALWEVLQPHWPLAVATPCTTAPRSPLKIGHRYVRLSVPPHYRVDTLLHDSKCYYCEGCNRLCWSGLQHDTDYCVLPADTNDVSAFVCNNEGLMVTPPLRREIDKIGIGVIGWRSCALFDEIKVLQKVAFFELQQKMRGR